MDTEPYWKLVEPIWESVSIYDGGETFLAQFSRAPVAARNLLAAHWCQSEVGNGGFEQFFGNSTGVLAPEAAAAFVAIGMPKVGAIVLKAAAWFGAAYPRDELDRQQQLEDHLDKDPDGPNPFEALDDEFSDLVESEGGGFVEAANRYAASNDA